MDLALNNLQKLICYKTQTNKLLLEIECLYSCMYSDAAIW